MGKTSGANDPAALAAAAQKGPKPVYLLVGEPFQTGAWAHALIDALVPANRRSFNLETYDGRSTPIAPVLDSLRMRGLFAGTKVVWVREPTLFLSKEKRSDVAETLFADWAEERHGEAADKLLALAAMAGWTQEAFRDANWAALPGSEATALLGGSIGDAERSALAAIAAYCLERGLSVGEYRDDSGLLQEFLAAGVPPGSVLIFTAAAVDQRKRVFKAVAEAGVVVELSLERERSGALSAESVDRLVRQSLEGAGKRLAPAARRLLERRAGSDGAMFASELEKLRLYVGDRQEIGEEDVREGVRDLGESWIFDFTKAIAQRQAGPALTLLRGLFAQGEHPLRLLSVVAREIRLLLLARDCLSTTLAGQWNPRLQYPAFQQKLLPLISEEQREAFGKIHPYVLFLCLQNASRFGTAVLQRAMLRLQELDIKMKSSPADPRILLEGFVLNLCVTEGPARAGG